MEGGKAARELPGIVDQVISMHLFSRDADGGTCSTREPANAGLVCRAGNPFGLPAKDRSGRLDVTEPPDLGALLAKINTTRSNPRARQRRGPWARRFTPPNRTPAKETDMFDLNDAEPQMTRGELIPDGTFAKVTMTIRPGGVNGSTPMDAGLLKASQTSDAKMLDCEFTVVARAARPAQVLADVHRGRRQGRREGPLDRLEDLEEHLPRHDRQRARPRSPG